MNWKHIILLVLFFGVFNSSAFAGERADDMFQRPFAKAWYETEDRFSFKLGYGWNPDLTYSKGGWLQFKSIFDDFNFESANLTFDWTFQGSFEGSSQWFIRPILGFNISSRKEISVNITTKTNTTVNIITQKFWVPGFCKVIWKHGKKHGLKHWHPGYWVEIPIKEIDVLTTEISEISTKNNLDFYLNPALQGGIFVYDEKIEQHGAIWAEIGFRNDLEGYFSINFLYGFFKWAEIDFSVEGVWVKHQNTLIIARVGGTVTKEIDDFAFFTRVGGIFTDSLQEFEWLIGIQYILR